MRFSATTSLLAVAAVRVAAQETPATGELGDADIVDKNPLGAVYRATFGPNPLFTPDTPAGGPVIGEIIASTPPSGVGVMFKIDIQNLPKEGGPFTYHLHVDPVPEDGNCTKTLAHLDPYIRGEDPVCDPSAPEKCQVGDLTGKYGKIEVGVGESYQASFSDDYLALYEGPGAFFGNRSIVLHFANKTRIACANFVVENPGIPQDMDEEDCTTTTSLPGSTTMPTPNTTTTVSAGGASETTTTVVTAAAVGNSGPMVLLMTASISLAALFSML